MIVQLTGLSGAGKTSIAKLVQRLLESGGHATEVIDGDQYRRTLCSDLGFTKEDRCENIRRLGVVASSFSRQNVIAIISAINPYEETRKELREVHGAKTVWIDCSMQVLLQRDTKGLYRRALLPDDHPDKISNLTGINDVYEIPGLADLVIQTDSETLERSAQKLLDFILAELKQ